MPDDLVSLKETPRDIGGGCCVGPSEDYYPSVYLSDSVVEDLGLEDAKVGEDMYLTANIRISHKSVSDSRGEKRLSVTLELREGKVSPAPSDAKDPGSILYGE
jgi:hypothetical protein